MTAYFTWACLVSMLLAGAVHARRPFEQLFQIDDFQDELKDQTEPDRLAFSNRKIDLPWNQSKLSMGGNFFYAQLNQELMGPQYVQFGVGSSRQEIKLLLHSQMDNLAMISSDCTVSGSSDSCNATHSYNATLDADVNMTNKEYSESVRMFDQSTNNLVQYNLQGAEMTTSFNITLQDYLRQFEYTAKAQSVDVVGNGPLASSSVSGFLGFAPNQPTKNQSLLHQLQESGHINNEVLAFYVDNRDDHISFVKFGNFDFTGFSNFYSMRLLNTTTNDAWKVTTKNEGFEIMVANKTTGKYTVTAIFEPAYPYIYLHNDQFQQFKAQVQNHFTSKENMTFEQNAIYFNDPCKDINESQQFNMTFDFAGNSTNQTNDIFFVLDDLLIDSEKYNNETGKCYIGLFPAQNIATTELIFGQLYMNKYYTYFDAQMLKNGTSDSLNIGTGLRSWSRAGRNQILQSEYNVSSYFSIRENERDQSSWFYTPNKYTEWRVNWGFQGDNTLLWVFLGSLIGIAVLSVSIYGGLKYRSYYKEKQRALYYRRNPPSPDTEDKLTKHVMKIKHLQMKGLTEHEINDILKDDYDPDEYDDEVY